MKDVLASLCEIAPTLATESSFFDESPDCMLMMPVSSDCAVTRIIEWAAPLSEYAGRGKWNDLDMLEVGNGNMTYDEYGKSAVLMSFILSLTKSH